ncbi:MAG: beta-1,6-N-acetylglucosaminyltransferase [Methylacidiphilales bacterium]|nr:beta-1,6-N-acetylglucosaminyltransferase [Candidatus Methylacidiphilales bacterium]
MVIAIGFLPSLFSLWVIRKAQKRTRSRLRQAASSFPGGRRIPQSVRTLEGGNRPALLQDSVRETLRDRYYLDGVGYLIGDISCQFNARSGYIRCAVNPSGPCEGCRFYESHKSSCSENNI